MEQFRKKIGWIIGIFLFLSIILFKWYSEINHKRIYTEIKENHLNNSQKIEKFGYAQIDNYDAYYKKEITYLETRSNIPFVWNTVVLNESKTKLYTKEH